MGGGGGEVLRLGRSLYVAFCFGVVWFLFWYLSVLPRCCCYVVVVCLYLFYFYYVDLISK